MANPSFHNSPRRLDVDLRCWTAKKEWTIEQQTETKDAEITAELMKPRINFIKNLEVKPRGKPSLMLSVLVPQERCNGWPRGQVTKSNGPCPSP